MRLVSGTMTLVVCISSNLKLRRIKIEDNRTSKDIRKEIKQLKKLVKVKQELLGIVLMQEELSQIKLQKTFDAAGN